MPLRPFRRDRGWLAPVVTGRNAQDHPARFVDAVLEGFDAGVWDGLHHRQPRVVQSAKQHNETDSKEGDDVCGVFGV